MSDEFHKPFLKSLLFIAFVTIFAMASSHYAIRYYANSTNNSNETTIYTIKESNIVPKQ